MESLFGLPIADLMTALIILFLIGAGLTTLVALKNRVFFRMAMRNIPRRRAQTILIVFGLMLATLLFSASFSTGDTFAHSIRVEFLRSIGLVDEVVTSNDRETSGQPAAFAPSVADRIADALADAPVDGVMPAYAITVPVVAPATNQNEPRVGIRGLDPERMAGFDPIETLEGAELPLSDLGPNELYLSAEAADNLNVAAGATVQLFLSETPTPATVAGIMDGSGEPTAVMLLSGLQAITGDDGLINRVFISNDGGLIDGAEHTASVVEALDALAEELDLDIDEVKREALDTADEAGAGLASIFLLFGNFSIIAGVLLIFLIFVMLAAERKREMGIARAIGGQRHHIVRLFAFEGAVYSLMAAAVGSVLGILVGMGMVRIMAPALSTFDFDLQFAFRWQSVVTAFTLGMGVTFAVVLVSSWRVSNLNVVRAVRDLPDPPPEPGRLRELMKEPLRAWGRAFGHLRSGRVDAAVFAIVFGATGAWFRFWWGLLLTGYLAVVLGVLLVQTGIGGEQLGTFLLGLSLIVIGIPLALKHRRLVAERPAYTLAGVLLVVLWIVPWDPEDLGLPEMQAGIEMFILSGVMLVVGAVWVVIYNSGYVISALSWAFGRGRFLSPVARAALAYPMAARFRTGMTLAMFSLIVFTLMVIGFIISAFSAAFGDTRAFSGGFDVSANVSFTNPIPDLRSAINEADTLDVSDFGAIGALSGMPVQIKEQGTEGEPIDWFVTGVDAEYADAITYELVLRDERYATDEEAWAALNEEDGVVILSPFVVPARADFTVGDLPDFQIEGFFRDDESLPEVYIDVWDPSGDRRRSLRVIGVAVEEAFFVNTVITGHDTLQDVAGPVDLPFLRYMMVLNDPAQAPGVVDALEAEFLDNGLRAEDLAKEISDQLSVNLTFNRLIQGFMGLGLVVGIAALGVIAARSVVERRTHIGIMRAVGYQRSMVQAAFLLESSFIALLGIAVGMALAFGLSVGIVQEIGEDLDGVEWTVPWGTAAIVFGVAYGAALLTTFIPARQASRIFPAEALRFEE